MKDSEYIDGLLTGFRSAQLIMTAHRLGLFSVLSEGPLDFQALALRLECSPRGVRVLADALTGLGLLYKREELYTNSALAAQQLVPDSPESRCAIVSHYAVQYERWSGLYDAVTAGQPVADELIDERLLSGELTCVEAMADSARMSACRTAELLELESVTALLDLGGGAGVFAVEFAQFHPELTALIVDQAAPLEAARRRIASAGVADRVSVCEADVLSLELSERFDLIFASNFFHLFSAECCDNLVRRCAGWLAPGGRLCVKDFFLDQTRTAPAWSSLFSVEMLLSTAGGACHTEAEVRSWFARAGLQFEGKHMLNQKSGLLLSRRGAV